MPIAVVLTLPQLVAGVVSIFGSAYGLLAWSEGKPLSQMKQEIERMILDWVVSYVAHKSGLRLNDDDPLSDASFCNAISERIGVTIRTLKDKNLIKEDLDGYATELISSKSGYTVRSVQNVAMLKEDFLRIGAAELSARLGLPAGVMPGPGAVFDAGAVREQLLLWAKAELMAEVSSKASIKAADILGAVDLEATAAGLNARFDAKGLIDYVSAKQIAVRIASEMATDAIVEFQKFAINGSKKSRRRELLRAAQAKFRAAHGNRQKYVPLGMSAVIG